MSFSQMLLQCSNKFETFSTNHTGWATMECITRMRFLKVTFSRAGGCKCLATNQTLITGYPTGICNGSI